MLSTKHKDKLIGGLITLTLAVLGYVAENYFDKTKLEIDKADKPTIEYSNKLDSSKQKIDNQIIQANSNKGDVNNTFIKKEIYNTPVKEKQPEKKQEIITPITDSKPNIKEVQQEAPIINHGNLSKDQKGGTVIQNYIATKPAPRHLLQRDEVC